MSTKKKSNKNQARLQALIEDATVDCNDEEEQLTGLHCMIEENVVFPFQAEVIGEKVTVSDIEISPNGQVLVAVCQAKGKKYRVDLNSLEWPEPHPEGFERIEAYLAWREWSE